MQTARHEELRTIIKESVKEAREEEFHYGKPEKRSVHSETISV